MGEAQRPARVVFLLQDLEYGGAQRQYLEVARRLDRDRFQVELWMLTGRDDLAPLAREWRVLTHWLSRRGAVGPVSLTSLWRRLHRERKSIDLILLLTVVPNIWGRILGRLAGIPVIVGSGLSGKPQAQHEGWLWPLADHLVCNSRREKDLLSQRYGISPERVTLIPNGVDTSFFAPAAGPARPKEPVVLAVGRLVPVKDHELLIQAFRLVLAEHPQAALWLVGDGPLESVLQKLAEETLPPGKVRFFPGQVDVRPFYAQASLLVISSVCEGVPNVVLEAMASSLPVVATEVGGLPEVVVPGQTGWLVPRHDPLAMAAAINRLLGEAEARQAFGEAARRRAEEAFSMASFARRHEELFQRLLDRKLAPRQS
jgi:glycosyltransferase involved in cell wall biosynthesis